MGLKGLQGGRRSENELSTEEKNKSVIIKSINLHFIFPLGDWTLTTAHTVRYEIKCETDEVLYNDFSFKGTH